MSVLILSDGKKGHEKQSQALCALWQEQVPQLKVTLVRIQYRNHMMRVLADLCASMCGRHALWAMDMLRLFVDRHTWEALKGVYADAVVSTGSFPAAVNKLFSASLDARSIVILRPNIPLSRFDLAIIPEHDRIVSARAVTIKGALFSYPSIEEKKKL